MLRDKTELISALSDRFNSNISNSRLHKEWVAQIKNEYDMPERVSSDYITLRKDLSDASVFALFIFCEFILTPVATNYFFTKEEIKEFRKSKWHVETIKFPIKLNMVKINDEQFIGGISVKELMLFRDAQLINYNENAQRTMQHIVKGDVEFYQIALNKEAVSAIMESYERDLYIPNTITLNLAEDADYYYNEKKQELVINSASHFDILDGYHRYVAMSKIYSINPQFDYEMELRIVLFTEDKARRFIWQEDQKTKMRKVDSESFNTAKASNKIVSRLNNDPSFILSGKISRNNGQINAAELSNVIDVLFLKGLRKSDETRAIIDITKTLKAGFDITIELNPEMAEQKWNKKHILALAYAIRLGKVEDFKKQYERLAAVDNIYANATLAQADITRIGKLNALADARGGVIHGSVL